MVKIRTIDVPDEQPKRPRGRPRKNAGLDMSPVFVVYGRTKEGPMPLHVARQRTMDLTYDLPVGKLVQIIDA